MKSNPYDPPQQSVNRPDSETIEFVYELTQRDLRLAERRGLFCRNYNRIMGLLGVWFVLLIVAYVVLISLLRVQQTPMSSKSLVMGALIIVTIALVPLLVVSQRSGRAFMRAAMAQRGLCDPGEYQFRSYPDRIEIIGAKEKLSWENERTRRILCNGGIFITPESDVYIFIPFRVFDEQGGSPTRKLLLSRIEQGHPRDFIR